MKKSLKTFFDSLRLFVLFIGCTFLFYYGLKWLDYHYASAHKYEAPGDGAVKVIGQVNQAPSSESSSLGTRFFQFLRDGQ